MVGFDLEAVHNVDGMIPLALDLWRDGLHPVPLADGRKEPPRGFPLSRWLESEPTEDDVVEVFRGRRNIGVALGEPSDGLTCRDFDRAGDYEHWRDRYPHIGRCCPTSRTHRGAHCYFISTAYEVASYCSLGSTGTVAVFPDGQGELRRGGYVVYPPSRHPNGSIYRFEITPDEFPFLADVFDAGLIPPDTPSQGKNISCVPPLQGIGMTVDEIVAASLPRRAGERHHCLFGLIRRLRAHPDTRSRTPHELMPIVEQWHRLAHHVIRTKDFCLTFYEFLDGWGRVRVPAGATIGNIAQEAHGEGIEWLDELCRLLQARADDGSFFLDCRTAGQLAGVGRSTISRWLQRLRAEGRIELVKAGSHAQHRASEYRYLGPMVAVKRRHVRFLNEGEPTYESSIDDKQLYSAGRSGGGH